MRKLSGSAVRTWARPTADDMDQVYKKVCSNAERFGLDLDDYQWAGMDFGKLMEDRKGEFTDDGCRLIDSFVQDEYSGKIEKQDIESEPAYGCEMNERVNHRSMAGMIAGIGMNGPDGILAIQELIGDELVATVTPDGDSRIQVSTDRPVPGEDIDIGFEPD